MPPAVKEKERTEYEIQHKEIPGTYGRVGIDT